MLFCYRTFDLETLFFLLRGLYTSLVVEASVSNALLGPKTGIEQRNGVDA